MSTPSSDTYIQVLYELALSIEPATEVEETLSQGIASYLQKLDCSGGAAFETQVGLEGGVTYDLVTKLPTRSSLVDEAVAEAPRRLPDTVAGLASECPVVDEVGTDVYRYYMRLPEFGVLVLTRRGSPLPDRVVQSLPRLNEKLATACGKVAVQRDYETQYRELFERAPVMFALTKRVGGEPVVADCNRRFASKLEYEVDDLVGRPLADLYTDESATVLEEDYERALAGEFGVEERVFRTRLGRRVTTLLRSTPRRDRDGTVVGTNSLYVDVTALKRRNQQLSVLNRILRHNLRNDLMAIHAQVETAIEHADDGTADRLADAAERAEGLLSTAEVSTRVRRIVGDTEVERTPTRRSPSRRIRQRRWRLAPSTPRSGSCSRTPANTPATPPTSTRRSAVTARRRPSPSSTTGRGSPSTNTRSSPTARRPRSNTGAGSGSGWSTGSPRRPAATSRSTPTTGRR